MFPRESEEFASAIDHIEEERLLSCRTGIGYKPPESKTDPGTDISRITRKKERMRRQNKESSVQDTAEGGTLID